MDEIMATRVLAFLSEVYPLLEGQITKEERRKYFDLRCDLMRMVFPHNSAAVPLATFSMSAPIEEVRAVKGGGAKTPHRPEQSA